MTGTDDAAAAGERADEPLQRPTAGNRGDGPDAVHDRLLPDPGGRGRDARTVVPVVAAFAVVAIVLAAIVVGGMLAPASQNVTEADKMAVAVRDFVDARNSHDPNRLRAAVCPAFDEARAPLPAVRAELMRVERATADNGRGKAEVTVKVNGTEQTSTWTLARTDGRWQVCG